MNVAASLSNPKSDKFITYKDVNGWGVINFCVLQVLCILNTVKTLQHGFHFNFSDIFWPVMSIINLLIFVDILVTRRTFALNYHKLIVIKRKLFYKVVKTYELNKIEDLEVERVTINTIFKKKESDEYIVTFFYNDKQIALGKYLNKFNAQGLYEDIIAARNQN